MINVIIAFFEKNKKVNNCKNDKNVCIMHYISMRGGLRGTVGAVVSETD